MNKKLLEFLFFEKFTLQRQVKELEEIKYRGDKSELLNLETNFAKENLKKINDIIDLYFTFE